MSDTIFNLLFAGLIFWSCFLLCDLSLKRTSPGMYIYLIVLGIFIVDCAMYYFTSFSSLPYDWYLFALFPIIVLPLFYKNQLTIIVFTYVSSLLFSFMIQTAVKMSDYIIYMNYPSLYVNLDTALILMIAMSLYLVCIPAFLRFAFHRIAKIATERSMWITWMFPIVSFIILIYHDIHDAIYTTTIIRYMGTLLFLVLLTYVIFYMILTSHGKNQIGVPARMERKQQPSASSDDLVLYEKQYFETIINSYNDTLDRTYVLEKGLHTIQRLLNDHQIDEALHCLDQLQYETNDIQLLDITGNSIVDTLLSYYHYLFSKDDLKITYDIHLPINKIRDLDLCILLGGLLQNAYDLLYECKISRGDVALECNTIGNKLQITCSNTYTGSRNDIRKSTNNFNLRSVRELCTNYHGNLRMECPQDILYVYADLYL